MRVCATDKRRETLKWIRMTASGFMHPFFISFVYFIFFGHINGFIDLGRPCHFPGGPANGNVTPYQDLYQINAQIRYVCYKGYEFFGLRNNTCTYGGWLASIKPPLCKKNFAFSRPIRVSGIENYSECPSGRCTTDSNSTTCAIIKIANQPYKFWAVELENVINITEVGILVKSYNKVFHLSFDVRNGSLNNFEHKSAAQCESIKLDHSESSLERTITCNHFGNILVIVDKRPKGDLHLCDVNVFSKIDLSCGEPDRNAHCRVKNISLSGIQRIEYFADPGYTLDGGNTFRECFHKWTGAAPYCIPKKSSHSEIHNSGTQNANSTKSTQPVNPNFIIGIAIGVTAASLSTIVVIVVVVVVMKKYYRRNASNSSTIVDSEGIFMHSTGNSVSSNSPTIQPTYSNPWDDPSFHVYEYINDNDSQRSLRKPPSDSIPGVRQVNVDKAGYLAHRSSGKQQWTNSNDRTARASLLRPRADPNRTAENTARINSFNELEVEAYGYSESDTIRV